MHERADVIVVGGGPAGLAAALGARKAGAARVLVVDRENKAGGVLWQCIHPGFGLHHFKEELTGPEYAQRFLAQALEAGVEIINDSYVLTISPNRQVTLMSRQGMKTIEAGAVILAMGARERTRGAIKTAGTRPAGVMTAGLAQRFVNIMGALPGGKVVILGSGDIGLIMARRLTLEGVEVAGVFEIMPYASGLNRNIVQCLHDFDIPLHLSTTITEIHGHDRVEKVTVAPVDKNFQPITEKAWDIPCDAVLMAVGLIPENELSRRIPVAIDPVTRGPVVDSNMQTSVPGVFACGNVVHIHDLVDFVTSESMLAGENAGAYALGRQLQQDTVKLVPGENVAYCVPQSLAPGREHTVYLRVKKPLEACHLKLGEVYQKRLRYAFPAEMVQIRLRSNVLDGFSGDFLKVDAIPVVEGTENE